LICPVEANLYYWYQQRNGALRSNFQGSSQSPTVEERLHTLLPGGLKIVQEERSLQSPFSAEASCSPYYSKSENFATHPSGPDFVALCFLNCALRSSAKMFSRVAARHSSYTSSIRATSFRRLLLPRLGQRAGRQYATTPIESAKKTSDLPW